MNMTVASCGAFDAIWDRGALVAVDKEERKGSVYFVTYMWI